MHALIQDNQITQVGPLPRLYYDGTRWWDYRDGQDPAAQGWHEIVETPRPDDTATTTHDRSIALVEGVPTVVWVARDKTPDEIEQEARFVSIEDRLARIEAKLWPAEPDPTDTTGVPTWAELGGIAPAGALLLDGGKVWRNVSGVPLTEPPSRFVGWSVADLAHLWAVVIDSPDPDPGHPAWEIGLTVTPGITVLAHNGRLWRAKVAHVTHFGWEPGPGTHAVWEDLGPA